MPTIEIDSRFAPKLESKLNELIRYADYLNISEIWLFGSVARGTCNAFSDICEYRYDAVNALYLRGNRRACCLWFGTANLCKGKEVV